MLKFCTGEISGLSIGLLVIPKESIYSWSTRIQVSVSSVYSYLLITISMPDTLFHVKIVCPCNANPELTEGACNRRHQAMIYGQNYSIVRQCMSAVIACPHAPSLPPMEIYRCVFFWSRGATPLVWWACMYGPCYRQIITQAEIISGFSVPLSAHCCSTTMEIRIVFITAKAAARSIGSPFMFSVSSMIAHMIYPGHIRATSCHIIWYTVCPRVTYLAPQV